MIQKIIVNTDALVTIAASMRRTADEYEAEYRRLLDMVLTMSQWQGKDSDAFKRSVASFTNDFKKLKSEMDNYADFTRAAARAYEKTENEAVNIAKNIR